MNIRDATESDIDFVAWLQLAASRSHLPKGLWEYVYDFDEDMALDFLRRLALMEPVSFFHWSLFVIAEVDGTPAAGMCGYDARTQGVEVMLPAMSETGAALGVDYNADFMRRLTALSAVMPETADGAWVVENVATKPEFRRRGLTNALLEHVLERGRARDFTIAQIAVLLGNAPAREAYLKVGFEPKDERRDAVFEADMGCPGVERLLITL